jgi:ComF family protein
MARSACVYEGVAKELVCVFKYKNRRPLASVLAGIMIDFLKNENGIAKTAEAVTFVPLHKKRLRERDFNQSEMLGRKVAAGLSLPVIDCLEKTRQTASQNELSRNERLVNLKGAFKTRRGVSALFRDRELLLVDDVMTTGATLDECSRTLLEAGARKIRCITFARGAGNDEDNR